MKVIRLKKERTARNMKKSELSRASGVQAGTISWIEEGRFKPYPSQLEKLATALGVDDPQCLLEEVEM